ncbi:MAG: hypothetical protein ACXVCY_04670 [Pseudobdellovibrionaceae bacterium]
MKRVSVLFICCSLVFALGTKAEYSEEQVVKKIDQITKSVNQMTPQQDDLTCNCKLGGQTNILMFEKPEDCGPERNYLQSEIKAFAAIDKKGSFSAPRDYSKTADVLPRKCALFIMRKFWKDRALTPQEKLDADLEYNRTAPDNDKRPIKNISEYHQDPAIYSKCDKDRNGVPVRYGHKACVTEDYVNLVYNSLLDVTDCLDVPPKFVAPKLSNESGLHVNAFGLVNDGGIGQFTVQALEDVKQNYEEYKSKIVNSSKASCKRIKEIPGAVPASSNDIMSADANRCHAIATPPNPLRSLVYYSIFFHATMRNSERAFYKSKDSKDENFRSTEELMKQAKISDFDIKKIKDMLFVMSYNVGPDRPATVFREWLKYRIGMINKYSITKADFNMVYWPESNETKNSAGQPTKKGEERAKIILAKKPRNRQYLSFAEYLFAYGDSLYIAAVKAQAQKLDKELGAGTCTENKFLEL